MSSGNDLELELLPDLPQSAFLKRLAPRIWAQHEVVALWVGGSLARGEADAYSDVDLHVAVTPDALADWREPDIDTLFENQCLVRQFVMFGKEFFLHHLILSSGEMYDLVVQVQSTNQALMAQKRIILGCRDAQWRERLQTEKVEERSVEMESADPHLVRRLIEGYWLNTHKHRKAIFRELDLVLWEGMNRMRPMLLRLAYILATGKDSGNLQRSTIHSMTPVVYTIQQTYGNEILNVVGVPIRSQAEMVVAIEHLNDAVADVGRQLAEQYEFDYPAEVEAMVRRSWQAFKADFGAKKK